MSYGCNVCGGRMIGDGLHSPLRCENYELPDGVEADSGPWYCEVTSEKWTKGPWIIEFCNCDEEGVLEEAEFTGAIMDKEGKDIAHVHNESNARIIAAAPEMYAMLKEIKDRFLYPLSHENSEFGKKAECLGPFVDELLKEARGEQ